MKPNRFRRLGLYQIAHIAEFILHHFMKKLTHWVVPIISGSVSRLNFLTIGSGPPSLARRRNATALDLLEGGCCLAPATTAVPAAAQQENDKNDDENRGHIHVRLLCVLSANTDARRSNRPRFGRSVSVR